MIFLVYFIQITLIGICFCQNNTIILKPSNEYSIDIGLIYLQGSQIPPNNYVDTLLMLQQKIPANLWIALPEFEYDLPDAKFVGQIMNQSITALKNAGCKINKTMPFFLGGHSLGAAALQEYLFTNQTYLTLPINLTGLIFTGSFLNRNYRTLIGKKFVPILTLGGELDGYCRITRITESFYFDYLLRSTPENSYTIVIKGLNHYQFVGDGTPPPYLVPNDITPEIDDYSAKVILIGLLNAFMKVSLCSAYTDCFDEKIYLAYALSDTAAIIRPIIDALHLEGYFYFEKPPCFSLPISDRINCTLGSGWTGVAQQIMGTMDFLPNTTTTDIFKPFNDLIILHPVLHNNCTANTSCVLNFTTYTQASYFIEYGPNSEDEAFNPVAAVELRAQMISRQKIILALTGKVLDFNQTDGGSLCAHINDMSISWALTNSPGATLDRYSKKGATLITGPDIESYDSEYVWMFNPLLYEQQINSQNNRTMFAVRSPMLRASLNSSIEWLRGLHYCKLLSPARALEWIYVDSLKPSPTP